MSCSASIVEYLFFEQDGTKEQEIRFSEVISCIQQYKDITSPAVTAVLPYNISHINPYMAGGMPSYQ